MEDQIEKEAVAEEPTVEVVEVVETPVAEVVVEEPVAPKATKSKVAKVAEPTKPARYYINFFENREPSAKNIPLGSVYYSSEDNDIHVDHIVARAARITTILSSDIFIPSSGMTISRSLEPKEWVLNAYKAGNLLENIAASEPIEETNY